MAAIKKAKRDEENLTLPPSFPQSFYLTLNKAAKKAGMPRAVFALKALRFYSAELDKKKSHVAKALGDSAESYADQARRVSQSWWATLTPEQKKARAQAAAEGRWGKAKKKK